MSNPRYSSLPSEPAALHAGPPLSSATFPPTLGSQSSSPSRFGSNLFSKFFSLFARPSRLVLGSLILASFILITVLYSIAENSDSLSSAFSYFLPPPSPLLQHFAYQRKLPLNEFLQPVVYEQARNGLYYPPEVYPAAMNPYVRANAAFVSLVRNSEQEGILRSMRDIEDRINRKFGYPWVFMNDEEFTSDFKKAIRAATRSETHFAVIPKEHWSYPPGVNLTFAALERQRMADDDVIYGGSEAYRHMCRFNSGFFYRQKVLEPFDYYWRVEPGVELTCDVDYDPFLFMERNNKSYGFTIALYEYERTIESLWSTVIDFAKLYPQHIAEGNSLGFLVDSNTGEVQGSKYNRCHFWSNFEIASLNLWRSQAYSDFFDYLDGTFNFFYERWGDAPVHSIAAALFLPSSQLHQFDDIAYRHNPFGHCPTNARFHDSGKCSCDPKDSFDEDGYSCMKKWWAIGGKPVY